MTNQYCPACAEEVVLNSGSLECEYAVVEEFPELVLPAPSMVSTFHKEEWTPKKMFANELSKIGMVIQQFRIITVYPHLPPESGIPLDNCYESGFDRMIEEVQNKKGVIILGGNLCKKLTGFELKQIQGLSGVPTLSFLTLGQIVFLPTVRTLYSTSGEFTLGLKRFAYQMNRGEEQ